MQPQFCSLAVRHVRLYLFVCAELERYAFALSASKRKIEVYTTIKINTDRRIERRRDGEYERRRARAGEWLEGKPERQFNFSNLSNPCRMQNQSGWSAFPTPCRPAALPPCRPAALPPRHPATLPTQLPPLATPSLLSSVRISRALAIRF
jgi:hypothetical protein